MTEASKEDYISFEWILYIYYPLCFWKDTTDIRALIHLGSEGNAMTLAYAWKLEDKVCYTNVGAQKIDGPTLKMFEIVLASFQLENKIGKA